MTTLLYITLGALGAIALTLALAAGVLYNEDDHD